MGIERLLAEARAPYAGKIMQLEALLAAAQANGATLRAELDGCMADHSAAVRELDTANARVADLKRANQALRRAIGVIEQAAHEASDL